MWKTGILIFGLATIPAQSAPELWTGNFTNASWTNMWAFPSAPAGKRSIIGTTNIQIVADVGAPGGGYLGVTYPMGSYGSPTGGCQFYGGVLRTNGNSPRESATLQYSVRFPSGFNFRWGVHLVLAFATALSKRHSMRAEVILVPFSPLISKEGGITVIVSTGD